MALPNNIDPSTVRWIDGPLAEKQTAATREATRQSGADARADAAAARDATKFEWEKQKHHDETTVGIPPDLMHLTGDDFLAKLPSSEQSQVKALAEGRMAFPAGKAAASPYWQQRLAQVSQYDPEFDAVNYNARAATRRDFTSGTSSRNIKALNTALGHLGQLGNQIDDTASHGGFPFATTVNQVENAARRGAGDSGITKFEQTAGALAGELTQVFRGTGGAEADIQRYLSEMNSSGSHEQKANAVANIAVLLKSRLDALNDQYQKGMGTTAQPLETLDPHAKEVLRAYVPGFADGGGGNGGGGSARGNPGGDTGGPGAPGGLAAAGDDRKAITIPPAMQSEYEAYVRNNRGKLDPDAFAKFRDDLDQKNGFAPNSPAQLDSNREYAKLLNGTVAKGGNLDLRIPPADAKMTGIEKVNASLFNNPIGAGVLGAGSGWTDELMGAGKALLTGGDRDSNIASMNAMRRALADKYPTSNAIGQVGGGILAGVAGGATLGAPSTLGGTVAAGAGYGALSGAGENNDNRLGGAITGAMLGSGGGVAGRYLAAPLAEKIASTRAGQATADSLGQLVERYTGKPVTRLPAPEMSAADKAVLGVNPDLLAVRANMSDAADLGLPYALADADPKLRMLGGAVARKSIDARDLAERTFEPRAADQSERAMQAIEQHLSPTVDIAARQQQWRDTANQQARPLYEEAFQGGSTAPLESQLGDAFNASSKAVAEARAELSAAHNNLTQTSARVSRAGDNVYMNSNAMPESRAAQSAVDGAQKRLEQAEAQHAQVTDQLRRSQGDASSDAPGAVWNPRLQQFIDDPLSQAGLARGLEVQRLEALAENRPFDPKEYAVTGYDPAGKPIVGDVPNMRTMDAIKRGYDAILDDYPRDMKGNQIFDQRGRAITKTKQALVGELDALNPAYAQARDTFGTFAQLGETLGDGYAAAPRGTYARDIAPQIENMTPAQLGEYQAGYATRLRDMAADASDSADPYKLLYGGNERRAKIGSVFPEGAPTFDRQYNLEQHMTKTRNETLGGSPTAGRLQADDQIGGGVGEMMAEGAGQVITGGGAPGLGTLYGLGKRYLSDEVKLGMGKVGQRRAAELAPIIFDTSDPRSIVDILDELAMKKAQQDARDALYQKYGSLLGATSAASFTPGGA